MIDIKTITLALFTAVNVLRTLAYLPQIHAAARCQNGATGVSLTTWGLFFASHVTTAMYAIINLYDLVMASMFALNAVCCAVIVVTTAHNRSRYRALNSTPNDESRETVP